MAKMFQTKSVHERHGKVRPWDENQSSTMNKARRRSFKKYEDKENEPKTIDRLCRILQKNKMEKVNEYH